MIIVTGGAGFIGSALIAKLNALDISNIIIVDDLGSGDKWKNLRGKRFRDLIPISEFLTSSILNSPIKTLYHLGATSSTEETNVDFLYRNNFLYSKSLAEICITKNIRFIYAGSSSVYGNGTLGFSDDDSLLREYEPLNPYGWSKYLFDQWVIDSGNTKKLVGLRFSNVFGPNEYHKGDQKSVVCKVYHQIKSTGVAKIFKSYDPKYRDGEQKRDFVYVKDICETMAWLMENQSVNGIFNLGTGKATSWNELLAIIFHTMKRPPNIEYVEMPEKIKEHYQYLTCLDMKKLASTGAPIPASSLEQSIEDYIRNHLEKSSAIW